MITLTNCRKKGHFDYTSDSLNASGYFDADETNTLIGLEIQYENDMGTASVFYEYGSEKPHYTIFSDNVEYIKIITDSIETIWNEVSESIKDSEEQEEEQTKQVQSKKK